MRTTCRTTTPCPTAGCSGEALFPLGRERVCLDCYAVGVSLDEAAEEGLEHLPQLLPLRVESVLNRRMGLATFAPSVAYRR
jgi:hypothetical protein